jgi:hypothetical protein
MPIGDVHRRGHLLGFTRDLFTESDVFVLSLMRRYGDVRRVRTDVHRIGELHRLGNLSRRPHMQR